MSARGGRSSRRTPPGLPFRIPEVYSRRPGTGRRELSGVRRSAKRGGCREGPFVGRRLSTTVAVCTRNCPGPLRDCLAAIGLLDPPPDALIVVDQSDAADAERVRALCGSSVRYLRSEPEGLGFARQTAYLHCLTEILLFTDDDCLVRPQWAGALGAVFSVHHTAGAATGACRPHPAHPLPEWAPPVGHRLGGRRPADLPAPRQSGKHWRRAQHGVSGLRDPRDRGIRCALRTRGTP